MRIKRAKRVNREELAAFLRAHRNSLSPEAVGLPRDARRRAPGLRRAEVAQLSGVGVTWYTWLEQARTIQVSAHFLHRLARALRLDSAEEKHLFALCELPPPERVDARRAEVSEGLRRFLDAFPGPAYLHTLAWDLLHWNTAATALYGDLSWVPPHQRNALRLIFLDARLKSQMLGWDQWARTMLARFRLDAAAILTDPRVIDLIEELKRESQEFRDWWSKPEVVGRDETPRNYRHPAAGTLAFLPTTLAVDHAPGLRIRVFTAQDVSTQNKMRNLVDALVERDPAGRRVADRLVTAPD
ncbi:MAG: hypothetical protein A2W18_10515 [Candidatus Muproteobacteria bacterium RBG_16_60_9]|uniref:HTH cro/C1-type domain-containing protein n=1 Tax=Candidatus Muproteobacteria bacterium RBG_16_60_9 TaxID=1817755 RepID=A0A1F6V8V7_9PROT|nr:MAG: hypothetical protein A2W18_10515 [Candidatus Muproteobacteria bacterium RBG_16_60_9]